MDKSLLDMVVVIQYLIFVVKSPGRGEYWKVYRINTLQQVPATKELLSEHSLNPFPQPQVFRLIIKKILMLYLTSAWC